MKELAELLDVRKSLLNFLQEDIGSGDITSNSIISPNISVRAEIICRAKTRAIVCGLEEASIIFNICKCKTQILVKDGSNVGRGDIVMSIKGKAHSILKAERTAVNLIMRMSGIATETRRIIEIIRDINYPIRIASTRKTAPGLRFFDKKAVRTGAGDTHRMRLDDMIMIKDNHLMITHSVKRSVELARKVAGSSIKVECEVKNLEEAIAAINAGAQIVMLDNFSPEEAAKTIKEITKRGIRKNTRIELSGGINLRNIKYYAKAKPDVISIGYLTHSAKAIDYSLEIVDVPRQSSI
ncbi:MAG TPA: carboxylating nicotinate-nucleotide diphosphorylase [Nitrososphaeraceae archaeon]|jgi:nicotinate-nucleotide pyrophosphorylase (carboxylating)|nr:carboxylating nicotinate-nucleotide diphosphorylase [Nitrososphaeraceae archaeon]